MKFAKFSWTVVFLILIRTSKGNTKKHPHIILIVADDLGFNDVSFHGSYQIPTPNIDALAFSGVILNNYYVSPICTPSRSALFSGMHPIHTGMQHDVIYGATPYGFPLSTKILPEFLKDLGYSTKLVGKWHMGHYRRKYTPICRGFDDHFGHWTGHKDYYDNMAEESGPPAWGYDMRRNLNRTYEHFGEYTTDVYTTEAKKIIEGHDKNRSLFLMLSHTAVHSANPYHLLQAPQNITDEFSYIKNIQRRTYAAMVAKLDESVGEVVASLGDRDILKDSIIIFTTDNGGPAGGFNGNAASNWPLRGVESFHESYFTKKVFGLNCHVKNTLFEGGVRGVGFIWSPILNLKSRVYDGLMHIQDWLPTLMKAIGEDPHSIGPVDGIQLWDSLSNDEESPRKDLLHNIDDIYGNEGVRVGNWKLLHGTTYKGKWDGWFGPSGKNVVTANMEQHSYTLETKNDLSTNEINTTYFYNDRLSTKNSELHAQRMLRSSAGKSVVKLGMFPHKSVLQRVIDDAVVSCKKPPSANLTECNLVKGEYCLFNVIEDPCEYNNVAEIYPDIVRVLKNALQNFRNSAVVPANKPKDNRGLPKYWDYTWTTWMDFIEPSVDSGGSSNDC